MRNLEVVAMVYKSPSYFNFIKDQLDLYCTSSRVSVYTRIVGNDPTQEIEQMVLKSGGSIFRNEDPDEYYLNRVYRCWNYCVESSTCDLVVLVNSDMGLSDGWIDPLIAAHDNGMLPVSRLVESGKLRPGTHCIEKDFGRSPAEFDSLPWLNFVETNLIDAAERGGMFMPVLFDRKEFVELGGYPCGNPNNQSGDAYFFEVVQRLSSRVHHTCFNSLVYHIQEGEKDS